MTVYVRLRNRSGRKRRNRKEAVFALPAEKEIAGSS